VRERVFEESHEVVEREGKVRSFEGKEALLFLFTEKADTVLTMSVSRNKVSQVFVFSTFFSFNGCDLVIPYCKFVTNHANRMIEILFCFLQEK
jgi:hypothetical protein